MKRRPVAITIALTAAALALGAYHRGPPRLAAEEATGTHVTASDRLRMEWQRGVAYRYALEARADTTVTLPELPGAGAGGVRTEVDLAGDLTLRCLGEAQGATLLAASLRDLTRHQLRILGADALADDAAVSATFEGQEAFVEMDARGTVRAVYFAPLAPPLFKHAMRWVLGELALTLSEDPAAAAWTAEEAGPSGRATAAYVRLDRPRSVGRTRTSYAAILALPDDAQEGARQALDAHGEASLGPGGDLQALDDDERLVVTLREGVQPALVAVSHFHLAQRDTRTFDAADVVALDRSALEAHHPGERLDATPGTERQLLEGFAGHLTLEELLDGVRVAMVTGRPARGLASRATALLRLRPELADALGALFTEGSLTYAGQGLVLDILASAGTPRAQASMRAALASRAARKSEAGYGLLVQRLSFVAEPDAETLAFLAHAYAGAARGARTGDRLATAQSLGAAAAHLARSPREAEREAARRQIEALAADARAARGPEERAALIGAVGNAGSHDSLPLLGAMKGDPDDRVRAAVALALRKDPSAESRAMLLELVTDAEATVSGAALDALGYQRLGEGDVRAVASLVTAGRTPPEADPMLVTFASKHVDAGPPARAMLEAMLARAGDDARHAQRIRNVLAQLASR